MLGIIRGLRSSTQGRFGRVTLIPLELLKAMKLPPIPVTVGGTNNGTWTLNASVTNPVAFWNGDEMTYLRRTVVYTWDATSNPILDSAGAEKTDTDSVLGIWYMYLTADGKTLIPSQTAPSYVEYLDDSTNAGILGHPGTSRTQFYRYVGIHTCTTAATPDFLATKKIGYTYHFAVTSEATTTSWALKDFKDRVPAIEGILVAGRLETGVVATTSVSGSSVDDQGVITVSSVGLASNIIDAPFGPIESDGLGGVYAKDTVARGDVHITQFVDVV